MEIRMATAADVPLLCEMRRLQLIDEGSQDTGIQEELHAFFSQGLQNGSVVCWLGMEQGQAVATCGLCFYKKPPSFEYPSGNYAYLHSVYTAPAHRGKGYAAQLCNHATQYAKGKGYARVFLRASAAGRPVYQKLGYHQDAACMGNWRD